MHWRDRVIKGKYFNFWGKIDGLIDNVNQYEHEDGLVISGDIIPHGNPTENFKEIVHNLFCQHLNMNLKTN